MKVKLCSNEYQLMEMVWRSGEVSTKELMHNFKGKHEWNDIKVLQVIRGCVNQNLLQRNGPDKYQATFSKEQYQQMDNDGDPFDLLMATMLLNRNQMTAEQIGIIWNLVQGFNEMALIKEHAFV